MKKAKLRFLKFRKELIRIAKILNTSGLCLEGEGNCGYRLPLKGGKSQGYLITPSGFPFAKLKPRHIVWVKPDGTEEGELIGSSEKSFYDQIFGDPELLKAGVNAIVHTHSFYACVLAAVHAWVLTISYVVGKIGKKKNEIPLVPYHTYGTPELGRPMVQTFRRGYRGLIMANHGQTALGKDLTEALWRAMMIEKYAGIYYHSVILAKALQRPLRTLSPKEMRTVHARFENHGQKNKKT